MLKLGAAKAISIHGNLFSNWQVPTPASYYAIDVQTAKNIDSGGNWSWTSIYNQTAMPSDGVSQGLISVGDYSKMGWVNGVYDVWPRSIGNGGANVFFNPGNNITKVNGTGGVTVTGVYNVVGRFMTFSVTITATGTATFASTVGVTSFEFPLNIAIGTKIPCTIIDAATGLALPVGYVRTNSVDLPTIAARGGQIIVSGTTLLQ
jgi:hypothetical protein